jgi:hypothetical protein
MTKRLFFLLPLFFAVVAEGAGLVDEHVQRVQDLVARHRATVGRLAAPATAAAQALIGGGSLRIANNDLPFFYEGLGRAGGFMKLREFLVGSDPEPGDVLLVSYNAKTYQTAPRTSRVRKRRNAVVIAFGPKPPAGLVEFANWIDSGTSWNDDDDFVLTGNLLSMWSFSGELAAACARQGMTPVFWQSIAVAGSEARNAHYAGLLFHDGFPQMAMVQAGTLGGAYLDYVTAMVARIAQSELTRIVATGREMARRAAAGNPVTLFSQSHVLHKVAPLQTTFYEYLSDTSTLDESLARSGLLIDLGPAGVDLELWRRVRHVGASAVWVTGKLPNQTDFNYFGDTVINEQWELGDAAVTVPGYDVRILPVSGIAELFIYDLLLRAAKDSTDLGSPN